MSIDRKPIFNAVRKLLGRGLRMAEVAALDKAIDEATGAIVVSAPRPAGGLKIGAKGLALIKEFEGCELTAYKDPVGILTIGYGSTGPHVKPGMTITEAEAEALLKKDLARFESAVNKLTGGKVTQDQFDSLVAFAFNVGEGAGGLKTSTLLREHNAGDFAEAAEQFKRWNRAGGRVLAGLTRRRAAEAALYRSGS